MSRAFWLACFAVPLFLGAASLPAQDDPCTTRTVPVTVLDQEGNFVNGLSAGNFRGKLRGKTVQIQSATYAAGPSRMVIIFDVSRSMTEPHQKWEIAKSFAEIPVALASPDSSYALIIFASRVLETVRFQEGLDAVRKRLSLLRRQTDVAPKGEAKTAMLDAISAALDLLGPSGAGDMIYVVTDAGENYSREKASRITDLLLSAGVRLHGALIIDPGLPRYVPLESFAVFRRLVETSGGNLFEVSPSDHFPDRYWSHEEERRRIINAGMNRFMVASKMYWVRIGLPAPWQQVSGLNLSVTSNDDKRRRGLSLIYPRKLVPCDASQKAN